ncbi:hypothetical protein MBEHAL_0261 [Halarchaeum acidiphilum MH1-52-1]|uniref:Uncharacterized protein n=1 Tax=Halarchaeum acidiphilum MH1-52-1 TaxID=1261545 RepID=U2YCY7_9EURY|nr:hypothetical protein [Halarchaeum acidiphilum]GAD51501.1 hypothetical protein MBEHAL_0261 [Halarchaeum acidiphilum MH1-52-1]
MPAFGPGAVVLLLAQALVAAGVYAVATRHGSRYPRVGAVIVFLVGAAVLFTVPTLAVATGLLVLEAAAVALCYLFVRSRGGRGRPAA